MQEKIRVYKAIETVTDHIKTIDGVKHYGKKVIRYWAYSCMTCRTTYRGSRDPETPWASVLDTALEHPKRCPGDPFERLWKQVSAK